MEKLMQEALRKTILNEKNSFDYYRYAGKLVRDRSVKHLFELLADEQIAHLYIFHTIYPGREFGRDLKTLLNRPVSVQLQSSCRAIRESAEEASPEQRALEIALREELECINHYSALIRAAPNTTMKWIFKQALSDTRKHYEVIQEEYIRIMGIFDRMNSRHNTTNRRGTA